MLFDIDFESLLDILNTSSLLTARSVCSENHDVPSETLLIKTNMAHTEGMSHSMSLMLSSVIVDIQ